MRSTLLSSVALGFVLSVSLAACAESAGDATIDDIGGDDPIDSGTVVDAKSDHNYGNHDAGPQRETGAGNDPDAQPFDGGNSGDDSSTIDPDSGTVTPDSGTVDPDSGTVTPDSGGVGGTMCPVNSKYASEYLLELLNPFAVTCTTGAECSSSKCCYIDTCVAL
jgi:hypothetical protein